MKLATLSEKEIIITLIALALLLIMAFVFGSLMELIKMRTGRISITAHAAGITFSDFELR